ncbi:2217_t:CDS:2 [Paraglomus occultum]|uniref:2217_t:CDS:1 n=1 Tax=Paraglomus occultum TaxID=144539 RepID=A0A9N8Z4U9_9GLOM|nr:2217_t:CDS:2 [Paraglomus occultum]
MSILTKDLIFSKTSAKSLADIKNLNLWGCELVNVSLLKKCPNLEVLSLRSDINALFVTFPTSVNNLTALDELSECKNLTELYLRKNYISDINQVKYLTSLRKLEILWLCDNPCSEDYEQYRYTVLSYLPWLRQLDHQDVDDEEVFASMNASISIKPRRKPLIKTKQSFSRSSSSDNERNERLYSNINLNNSITNVLIPPTTIKSKQITSKAVDVGNTKTQSLRGSDIEISKNLSKIPTTRSRLTRSSLLLAEKSLSKSPSSLQHSTPLTRSITHSPTRTPISRSQSPALSAGVRTPPRQKITTGAKTPTGIMSPKRSLSPAPVRSGRQTPVDVRGRLGAQSPAVSERSSRGARTPDVNELKRAMSPIVVVDDTSLNGKARSLMVGGEMSRSLSRTPEPKVDYDDDVLESKKGKTQSNALTAVLALLDDLSDKEILTVQRKLRLIILNKQGQPS